MTFGERLMSLRRARGLSQEALGDMLDVTRQTVSKWERGDSTPELEKLVELSRIFGVSLDELAGIERTERPGDAAGLGRSRARREPAGAGTMNTRAAARCSACRFCISTWAGEPCTAPRA